MGILYSLYFTANIYCIQKHLPDISRTWNFKPLIESYDCVEAVNKCQTSAEMQFELFSSVPVHVYKAISIPQSRTIQPQF